MDKTPNDGSDETPRAYGRRAAETLDAARVLDRTIMMLLESETNQITRDLMAQVRILALMHRDKFVTQVADIYASAYTLDELKALVTFLESPAGEAMRKKQPDIEARIGDATMAFLQAIANNEIS